MNWKQLFTALKAALAAGGPSIISLMQLFGYQSSDVEKVVAAVATVVGIVLLIIDKSAANMAKDAASVPGVQVHAQPGVAPPSVIEAAKDPKVPDVIVMTGGPVPNDAGKSG